MYCKKCGIEIKEIGFHTNGKVYCEKCFKEIKKENTKKESE